ncbi:MAG: class I SAM-dependent methyltransferase [Actinomycetota bacterium]
MSTPNPFTSGVSDRWRAWRAVVDLDEYVSRWDRQEAEGHDVHGEADAVDRVGGRTVLDGGCGTGRVAIELARRGWEVVGVDGDADLLAHARRRAPALEWHHADLTTAELQRRFDVVVLAGGVLSFVDGASRPHLVPNLVRHLADGGHLISGGPADPAEVLGWSGWCAAAGLTPVHEWATWDGHRYEGGDYLVTVHRR